MKLLGAGVLALALFGTVVAAASVQSQGAQATSQTATQTPIRVFEGPN